MEKKIIGKCEESVCPICGGTLTFNGCREDDDNGCTYPWVCDNCGATGKEGYTLSFDGHHYDVETADGVPVETVAPDEAADNAVEISASATAPLPDSKLNQTAEELLCPVCGGCLEYTGSARELKCGIEQEWRCAKCGATGWAGFDEETDYIFNGEHNSVRLADGTEWDGEEIAASEPEDDDIPWYPATEGPTGRIVLLNARDMEDAMDTLRNANICAEEECGMIVIHKAPVEQAVKVLCKEGILLQAVTYEDNQLPTIMPPAPVKAAGGWFVPVTWEMFGVVRIPFEKAATLEEAFKRIKDDPDIELPKGHYVDDSFAPSYELEQIEEVRALYNDNRPDGEVSL